MTKLVRKVGNIKVYTESEGKSTTVILVNGCDEILKETCFAADQKRSIERLLQSLDTYTEEWLWINLLTSGLEKVSENLYKYGNEYFKRIDNTEYFKHFDHKPMM